MTKKLLLTGLISLCSISVANAVCTPPTTLKCNCAHPIIDAEGKLACGTSYCGDKKCMPDGSCCPEGNYCESTEEGKQCCSDGQSCNTITGCEEKKDLESLCKESGGYFSSNFGGACLSPLDEYNNTEAGIKWCSEHGMRLMTVYDFCPTWNKIAGSQECPENGTVSETCTSTPAPSGGYFSVEKGYGAGTDSSGNYIEVYYTNVYAPSLCASYYCK